MQIRIEEKYGRKVFVSATAEQGRVDGCLCVRTENGKRVMCANLLPNLEFEGRLKENLAKKYHGSSGNVIDSIVKKAIKNRGAVEMGKLLEGCGTFADDGVCRPALINYAVCLATNIAMGVSRCAHRKSLEGICWYRYSFTPYSPHGKCAGSTSRKAVLFEAAYADELGETSYKTILEEIELFDKQLNNVSDAEEEITLVSDRKLEYGEIREMEFVTLGEVSITFANIIPVKREFRYL